MKRTEYCFGSLKTKFLAKRIDKYKFQNIEKYSSNISLTFKSVIIKDNPQTVLDARKSKKIVKWCKAEQPERTAVEYFNL